MNIIAKKKTCICPAEAKLLASLGQRLTIGKDCHTLIWILHDEERAMATMNISLPNQMKTWVEECVQSGRYANTSDYVRDLIRKDHLKLEQLRQALIEGENSGPATELDIESFIADKKKSLFL